jgi:hypothetical protein
MGDHPACSLSHLPECGSILVHPGDGPTAPPDRVGASHRETLAFPLRGPLPFPQAGEEQ